MGNFEVLSALFGCWRFEVATPHFVAVFLDEITVGPLDYLPQNSVFLSAKTRDGDAKCLFLAHWGLSKLYRTAIKLAICHGGNT